MKKTLTVLIPVYNTEIYLRRCLDSILIKEVLKDIEVLIVSDGSKDDSVNIAKEYEKNYPGTVRLIEKENGGHGSTINIGIKQATGKYFKVVDSDDWVNCLDFVRFVQRLKKEDSDCVVTDYKQLHVYNQREFSYGFEGLKDGVVYNFDEFDLSLLKGEYFVMACSTYKLEILKKSNINLLEKTFYVDMQYNVESILSVETFTYYNLNIYRYYIGRRDQSVNITSFVRNKLHHEKVMKHLIDFFCTNFNKMSSSKKHYIEMILCYMLNTHYTIFCEYDTSHTDAYKQIKAFDLYLKEVSPYLYKLSNNMGFIRYHRKSKFLFVKTQSRIMRKIYSLLGKIKKILFRRRFL